jgi:hypothetical protein
VATFLYRWQGSTLASGYDSIDELVHSILVFTFMEFGCIMLVLFLTKFLVGVIAIYLSGASLSVALIKSNTLENEICYPLIEQKYFLLECICLDFRIHLYVLNLYESNKTYSMLACLGSDFDFTILCSCSC